MHGRHRTHRCRSGRNGRGWLAHSPLTTHYSPHKTPSCTWRYICYIVAMGEIKYLGEFEQMVLLAILHLEDGAYGLAIRKELEKRTGRKVSHGAAYITLDRLEKKGLLASSLGDPTPGRGGRAKRFFKVTPTGVTALRESRKALQNLWGGLDAVLGDS